MSTDVTDLRRGPIDVHVHLAGPGRLLTVVEREVERGGLRPRGQAGAAVQQPETVRLPVSLGRPFGSGGVLVQA